MDTWGSFSLTLIDALDTLLIMGNETEFKRAVEIVLKQVNVDANVNVSVFETNIRVVGRNSSFRRKKFENKFRWTLECSHAIWKS